MTDCITLIIRPTDKEPFQIWGIFKTMEKAQEIAEIYEASYTLHHSDTGKLLKTVQLGQEIAKK